MAEAKTRVVLADDHAIVRRGIMSVLSRLGDVVVVGEAADGSKALDMCIQTRPDIVILDITMPEMNGIVAAKAIRELCPDTSIIILSMHVEDDIVVEALRSGAAGYVLKEGLLDELTEAVRVVGEGGTYLSPDIASVLVRKLLDRNGGASRERAPLDILSVREMQVLQMLSEGRSTKEIASRLGLSPKTVDNHKANIMKKLEIYDVPTLVRFALKTGITKL
ncbi:MAG: response regulator transcription factor [Actinomycetota bacterium]